MRKIIILSGCVIKELLRRKDFYLIFVLLIVMIIYAGLISFGGEQGFQRYFKEIGISLAYIFSVIIAVTFASRQVPQEVESKTIYPILARPVSRAVFLIGKFAGVLLVSVISFTLFYAVFIVSSLLRGDFSSPSLLLAEGYLLHIFLLSFFTALTILLSLFLSAAANVGLSLIIYLSTNWFGASLPGYIYLPHPELFDIKEKIVHTWDLVPGWVLLFLGAYAAIYTSIFLFSACLVFKKRDL